eukprot:7958795-Prorocentrum_lima.AAC.1
MHKLWLPYICRGTHNNNEGMMPNHRSLSDEHCTRAPEAGNQSSSSTGRTCKLVGGICSQAGTWNET